MCNTVICLLFGVWGVNILYSVWWAEARHWYCFSGSMVYSFVGFSVAACADKQDAALHRIVGFVLTIGKGLFAYWILHFSRHIVIYMCHCLLSVMSFSMTFSPTLLSQCIPGPEVIYLFSWSAELSLKFYLLINIKLLISTGVFLLSLAEYEIFSAYQYAYQLSAEKISCSAELSTKNVL